MNRTEFGDGACASARKSLDLYLDGELPEASNLEVGRHVEACAACAAELNARSHLRARLKAAVNAQSVPVELEARIRAKIENPRLGVSFGVGWSRWAVAMAASLVVCAGIWLGVPREKMPALSDRPAQNAYIQKISASLDAVLKVGLGDHVHCSIFRRYPPNPPPLEKMEADLGPAYQGLLPVVRAAVPEGYQVVLAHRCSFAGRKFIHLTFKKNDDLLSLVVARRESGESMERLAPTTEASGTPIYQAAAGRYQVAGFEAGDFLAYVVSDLKGKANLRIAANIAPGVRDFLVKTSA